MEGHVVKGGNGEDDAGVAWRERDQQLCGIRGSCRLTDDVWDEEEDVLFFLDFLDFVVNLAGGAIHLRVAIYQDFFRFRCPV